MSGAARIGGLGLYRALTGRGADHDYSPDPSGPVWLHATSPDAAGALQVLAEALGDLNHAPRALLTGTQAVPGPGEDPRALAAFLSQHRPCAVVLAGDLLPPGLIAATRGRGLFLVNAVVATPPGRWRLIPGFTRALLSAFTEIHARTPVGADAFKQATRGTVAVHVCGPLARHPAAPPCNAAELDALRGAVGSRPIWLAWDLPPPEEDTALLAHAHALRRSHRLLMILVPRQPARGAEIVARARDIGFSTARRSVDQDILDTTQVYIADTDDDPGLFLRLAPVAWLGGSLSQDAGSPDPVLAAALGSALIFGRHVPLAHRAFVESLRASGGGRRIGAPGELGDALAALIAPDLGAEAALRAWSLATEGADHTAQLARNLCDWIRLHRS